MITLRNVNKRFSNQTVLENFNYQFDTSGFYLLFGPSGCGKTTLLNIISGIWNYDSGEVCYYDTPIEALKDGYMNHISYITQDAYFVDYLSLFDNLKLCEENEETIQTVLVKLQIEHVKDQVPSSLSGGERQRAAIARCLLLHREIILLDEPTSALDRKNRDIILAILSELKKDHLIICISHDPEVKKYCDQLIDFVNLTNYQETNTALPLASIPITLENKRHVQSLFPYVKKQFFYYKMNKHIAFFLILLLTSIMMMSFLFLNMESKILSSLGSTHHINAVQTYCPYVEGEDCLDWVGKESVSAVVYNYASGGAYYEYESETTLKSYDYADSLMSISVPMDRDLFLPSVQLIHGDYISNKMDIMLGSKLADEIALSYATTPSNLVGQMIEVETAHGTEKFQVSGIFDTFSDKQDTYLRLIKSDSHTANSSYFFSEQYTFDYLYDEQLSPQEKHVSKRSSYTFYFPSFEEAFAFQNNPTLEDAGIQMDTFTEHFSSTIEEFNFYSMILIPILSLFLAIMIIFHIYIQNVQMKYEKHILSVYQYCGYSLHKIKRATLLYYVSEMSILFVISLLLSNGLGYAINLLNESLHFSAFSLFSFSFLPCLFIYLLIILIGMLCITIQFHRIKTVGWYDLLRSRRDFL